MPEDSAAQFAYQQGAAEVPRPWSKYSEGASAHAKAKAAEAAEAAEPAAKVSVREEKKKRKLKHGAPEGAQGTSYGLQTL